MAKVKVHGGDLAATNWTAVANAQFGFVIMSATTTPAHPWKGESHTLYVVEISQLTEEKVKKLAGTALGGVAGAVLLGPLGAVGGMLLGGNKTQITFQCVTKCGKTFIGTTEAKFYAQLVAAALVGAKKLS